MESRTQKKSEAKDSLSEDRHSRGQGHKRKCSPKKKKVFTKIFQAISTKKRFPKNFSSAPQNLHNSKNSAVLEPRTGQFSRTRGQGLDLRGQGLQNVSSRTPPLVTYRTKIVVQVYFVNTVIIQPAVLILFWVLWPCRDCFVICCYWYLLLFVLHVLNLNFRVLRFFSCPCKFVFLLHW